MAQVEDRPNHLFTIAKPVNLPLEQKSFPPCPESKPCLAHKEPCHGAGAGPAKLGNEPKIREMVTTDIGRELLGINARREEGKVVYTVPIAVYVGMEKSYLYL